MKSKVEITVDRNSLYNGWQVLLCNGGMCSELFFSKDEDAAHNEADRIARESGLKFRNERSGG